MKRVYCAVRTGFGVLGPVRDEVRQVMLAIQARFTEPLPVQELAADVNLSRSQLDRVFLEQVGKTPKAYQELMRVKRMAALLIATDIPIGSIASAVGWTDASRAAQVFQKATMMLPSRYRQAFAGAVRDRPECVVFLVSCPFLLTFDV